MRKPLIFIRFSIWLRSHVLLNMIINMIINRAPKRQWQLNIGTYFLKKGVGYEIGQIIKKEPFQNGSIKVTYITGFTYDFGKNKVIHRTGVKVIK